MKGVILAGGKSLRMGTDKANLTWNGETFLTVMVDKLRSVCDEVIIVGERRRLNREVRWTIDSYRNRGPLAGLQAGLLQTGGDGALFLPCDMPALPISVLKVLIELSPGVDVVIPRHALGLEPLCAWYSCRCLSVVNQLLEQGGARLVDILPQLRVCYLDVEQCFPDQPAPALFANLNSPQEYVLAREANRPAMAVLSLQGADEEGDTAGYGEKM